MTKKPDGGVKAEKKRTFYTGFNALHEYDFTFPTPDGSKSVTISREIYQMRKAAGVIAYDPARDSLVMVEQFRCAVCLSGLPAFTMEVPAGLMDKEGASAEEIARMEVQEETGCTPRKIEYLFDYLPIASCVTEHMYVFYAEVDSSEARVFAGLQDDEEYIKVHVVPYEEMKKSLFSGEYKNSLMIIAMQWFVLNRDRLRAGK